MVYVSRVVTSITNLTRDFGLVEKFQLRPYRLKISLMKHFGPTGPLAFSLRIPHALLASQEVPECIAFRDS